MPPSAARAAAARPAVRTAPPPLIEAPRRCRRRADEVRRVGGFAPGDRVFHQKFGYGTVRAVEDNKLAIDFDKAGDKMVMDSFVSKAD